MICIGAPYCPKRPVKYRYLSRMDVSTKLVFLDRREALDMCSIKWLNCSIILDIFRYISIVCLSYLNDNILSTVLVDSPLSF